MSFGWTIKIHDQVCLAQAGATSQIISHERYYKIELWFIIVIQNQMDEKMRA